jgi:nucleotide-binding universal stress UspA family protein
MVAIDGSHDASRALELGIQLARFCHARLAVIHVVDDTHGFPPAFAWGESWSERSFAEQGEARLQRLTAGIPADLEVERFARTGDPAREIIDAATTWEADVIVTGNPSHHGLARLLHRSVDNAILGRTPCCMLVVEPEGEAHAAAPAS